MHMMIVHVNMQICYALTAVIRSAVPKLDVVASTSGSGGMQHANSAPRVSAEGAAPASSNLAAVVARVATPAAGAAEVPPASL